MSIYDDLKPIAASLMKEFKQGEVQLIKLTAGTGPADNPGIPTETLVDLDAVVKGVSYKYVAGGFAVASDLTVSAAPVAGYTPEITDFISIDGARYKIVFMIDLPAVGTRIVWKFIVRKGG